ncbi:DUF4126 domain-containing protein [Stutzerimonas xanthomarina]|uniref:Uncharacterized membrane protein n=2 Tax=Stutzerimonas xanthomarina TaxID=271420 RepID=A0A1M5U2M4_9GAMM|nr:DUF4126 domain-containing protein [Stutzerimonas xanthomarina]MCP9340487.1 DUF4126 domain-containing protein [Stutzerimonas xanthomarina]SEH54116.1 Uncharacterized membrane protein [Stutzerimonas xanthomarina]SHH57365.1 Uncharacterized membrane protein [Stutzerimonas xanthomarina DSM 18231]
MSTSSNVLWGALALGLVTGMRSMLAPTLTSRALAARDDIDEAGEPARTLAAHRTRQFLMPLAAGELLGDKMTFAPDRTILPSMAFRALSGGVTAAALASARQQPIGLPMLIGASAALVASKVGLSLRKPHQARPLTNAALGLAEDCLALVIGNAGLQRALGER